MESLKEEKMYVKFSNNVEEDKEEAILMWKKTKVMTDLACWRADEFSEFDFYANTIGKANVNVVPWSRRRSGMQE
ncbi:hypothetical protein Tco_0911751 [Tanacetum coccineum]|uniref:Uncharacterized protein n=1 Tax=Tanacetum coccineum TaxID=301880 RepID=A0ABQ5CWK7_9ASTR